MFSCEKSRYSKVKVDSREIASFSAYYIHCLSGQFISTLCMHNYIFIIYGIHLPCHLTNMTGQYISFLALLVAAAVCVSNGGKLLLYL